MYTYNAECRDDDDLHRTLAHYNIRMITTTIGTLFVVSQTINVTCS